MNNIQGRSMAPQRLLTVREVAERLQVKPYTIRKWVKRRKIEAVVDGRFIRFLESSIERFVVKRLRRKKDGGRYGDS